MSGVNIARVTAGQRLAIPAQDYNAMATATERVLSVPFQQTIGQNRAPRGGQAQTVLVRNDSGGDIPRFGWLSLRSALIDPTTSEAGFLEQPAFIGSNSAAVDSDAGNSQITLNDTKMIAIAVEGIPDGKCGRCVVRGILPVRMDIISEYHTHVALDRQGLFTSVTMPLRSAFYGPASILWKEDGIGEDKRAIIDIDPFRVDRFLARITGVAKLPGYVNGWAYGWESNGIVTQDPLTSAPTGGLAASAAGAGAGRGRRSNPPGLAADGDDVTVAIQLADESTQPHLFEMLAHNIAEIPLRNSGYAAATTTVATNTPSCTGVTGVTNALASGGGDVCPPPNLAYPRLLPVPIGSIVMIDAITARGGDDASPVGRFVFSALNPYDLRAVTT